MVVNYQNGKIYKMEGGGKTYIGSTCLTLAQRKASHISHSKETKTNVAYNWFGNLGWDNVNISLICDYPCNSKKELTAKENEIMNDYPDCLNTRSSSGKNKKKRADYVRHYNNEYLKTHPEYRKRQSEKAKIRNREEIVCECGELTSKGNLSRHKKSKRHTDLVGK